MNSLPLFGSIPMMGNEKSSMMCSYAAKTCSRALLGTERFTRHPVLVSVTVRVEQNSPWPWLPSWNLSACLRKHSRDVIFDDLSEATAGGSKYVALQLVFGASFD